MQDGMHLVIGGSGLVGSYLLKELHLRNKLHCGTYFNNYAEGQLFLDIKDRAQVNTLINVTKPKYIYITSSYTHVDACEEFPDKSLAVNVQGVKNVVDAAIKTNSMVVYFSSDYVFDGYNGPYSSKDVCNPINVYGKHKVAAENYISLYAPRHLIVRTCGVFGNDKKNFVSRLIQSVSNNQTVKVPNDQFGTPTYARYLATQTIDVAAARSGDTRPIHIHTCAEKPISRYEFGNLVLLHALENKIIKYDSPLLIPVETYQLNQLAKRPLRSGLISNNTILIDEAIHNYFMDIS